MARRATQSGREIDSYAHSDKERANNPPVGLVTTGTDPDSGTKSYSHDPHIDPNLTWAGKSENTSIEIPTVSLHVHERVDPRTIIEAVAKRSDAEQFLSFFDLPDEIRQFAKPSTSIGIDTIGRTG